jgi:hypothetical protein
LQAFQRSVQYELAGQHTGALLLLVVANNTYVREPLASSLPDGGTQATGTVMLAPRGARPRRYLELQAASQHSWICPINIAPGMPAVSALMSAAPAASDLGINYATLDPGQATQLAAMLRSSTDGGFTQWNDDTDDDALLRLTGCDLLQSFALVDVKWALQAQVGLWLCWHLMHCGLHFDAHARSKCACAPSLSPCDSHSG